jgi:hypothetical protein
MQQQQQPIQAPQNMTQNAGQNAMAGFQASFAKSGDNTSQAIMEMNAHLNDIKPYIDTKNVLIDALATQGQIDQSRLQGLNPQVRNAVINRDTNFILSNLKQVENVIQGNNLEFQNAVGIINQGMDRMEREKEREFNQSMQLIKTQVDMLGSKAFEGMDPEQIAMIEKRLGISVEDMASGLAGREDEARAEREWEKNFKVDQFAHSQKMDEKNYNLNAQKHRDSVALQQSSLALQRQSMSQKQKQEEGTWGKVSYEPVMQGSRQVGEQTVYFDPNGRKTTMAQWVTRNYPEQNRLSVIQQELMNSGRSDLALELVERANWAEKNNDKGHMSWFLRNKLSGFGF